MKGDVKRKEGGSASARATERGGETDACSPGVSGEVSVVFRRQPRRVSVHPLSYWGREMFDRKRAECGQVQKERRRGGRVV